MTHYTAVIEVNKVDESTEPELDSYGKVKTPGRKRTSADVARIVVRADNLVKLREKIAAHVELID